MAKEYEGMTRIKCPHCGKHYDTPIPARVKELEKMFDRWWAFWPRKDGKKAAQKAFIKIAPSLELLETMIDMTNKQAKSEKWRKDGGKFIPMPATWLNGERWEDEGVGSGSPTKQNTTKVKHRRCQTAGCDLAIRPERVSDQHCGFHMETEAGWKENTPDGLIAYFSENMHRLDAVDIGIIWEKMGGSADKMRQHIEDNKAKMAEVFDNISFRRKDKKIERSEIQDR
jgi:hypothetical protein